MDDPLVGFHLRLSCQRWLSMPFVPIFQVSSPLLQKSDIVLILRKALWLKWWTEESIKSPNTSLGKWLGVYAVLSVGSIMSLGLGTW